MISKSDHKYKENALQAYVSTSEESRGNKYRGGMVLHYGQRAASPISSQLLAWYTKVLEAKPEIKDGNDFIRYFGLEQYIKDEVQLFKIFTGEIFLGRNLMRYFALHTKSRSASLKSGLLEYTTPKDKEVIEVPLEFLRDKFPVAALLLSARLAQNTTAYEIYTSHDLHKDIYTGYTVEKNIPPYGLFLELISPLGYTANTPIPYNGKLQRIEDIYFGWLLKKKESSSNAARLLKGKFFENPDFSTFSDFLEALGKLSDFQTGEVQRSVFVKNLAYQLGITDESCLNLFDGIDKPTDEILEKLKTVKLGGGAEFYYFPLKNLISEIIDKNKDKWLAAERTPSHPWRLVAQKRFLSGFSLEDLAQKMGLNGRENMRLYEVGGCVLEPNSPAFGILHFTAKERTDYYQMLFNPRAAMHGYKKQNSFDGPKKRGYEIEAEQVKLMLSCCLASMYIKKFLGSQIHDKLIKGFWEEYNESIITLFEKHSVPAERRHDLKRSKFKKIDTFYFHSSMPKEEACALAVAFTGLFADYLETKADKLAKELTVDQKQWVSKSLASREKTGLREVA